MRKADEILSDQIDEELATFFEEPTTPASSEEEFVLGEEGMGDKIKKLFKLKNDKQINGVAKSYEHDKCQSSTIHAETKSKRFCKNGKKMGELPAMEEVQEEVQEESVEKTIEKLAERNMLGRLAKQLQLNETGKEQLFNYFEKGS